MLAWLEGKRLGMREWLRGKGLRVYQGRFGWISKRFLQGKGGQALEQDAQGGVDVAFGDTVSGGLGWVGSGGL